MTAMINSIISQSRRRQGGVAALEFALVIIFLLLIVSGIVGFGFSFWYYNALSKATRDGARLLSMAPVETVESVGVPAAIDLVVDSANAARLSPALSEGQVTVTCLDTAFAEIDCEDDTAPAYVRVEILDSSGNGYLVTLGGFFPFFGVGGDGTFTTRFTPHTTMRYMK